MQISRYSAPEFDPYGDNRQQEPDAGWLAPTATAQLESVVAIPGSKSLTNRELVLAALADGPSTLHAPLWSRDSELMSPSGRSSFTALSQARLLIRSLRYATIYEAELMLTGT